MRISLNWLKRYVDLPENPRDIAQALTALGFEVESLNIAGEGVQGVVVGEVRQCVRHPEADRLSVCRVFDGKEEVQVVCGASNVTAGQKVLFARVGAELPGGLSIKKAKLRGQESFGMICAEDELGLGTSHDGIMVLDPACVPGMDWKEIPGLADTIFEINVTPNRPDALGHLGVARELAARFGKPLRYPSETLDDLGPKIGESVSLELQDEAGCTRYVGRVVRGVRVGESPAWLKTALNAAGQKSINNVVDLTNFVLLEWGQPCHAFDLEALAQQRILVRRARSGETIKTLDGVERKLDVRDLVIADGEKPQVLAGVMGGEYSGISEKTKDVFLEVAFFDPRTVRAQARRHGLQSDSSFRFERGVDPLATSKVCDYLTALVVRWCGGQAAQGRVEALSPSHPKGPRIVSLRSARAGKIIGVELDNDRIGKLLAGIEIRLAGKAGENLQFEIPGFRPDLEREADLIEEIARLMDYNAIPAVLPVFPIRPVALPPNEVFARSIRFCLRDQGLCESQSLRFTSRRVLGMLNLAAEDERGVPVLIRNPLSEDWEALPTSSVPALLMAVERNQNNQEKDVRLFELGRAFFPRPRSGDRDSGVREEPVLGLALSGDWKENSWEGPVRSVDFLRLKGVVENLLEGLRLQARWQFGSQAGFLHPSESAELFAEGADSPFAVIGMLHPKCQTAFGLRHSTAVAEFHLSAMLKAANRPRLFTAYPSHASVERDINVVVENGFRHESILSALPKDIPHLRLTRLNSVYKGPGVPEGHKALHYSFVFRHAERTLTEEDVNPILESIKAALVSNPAIRIK